MPTKKRNEGKQVYSFGKLQVYFDKDLIYCHNAKTGDWSPVGMDELSSQQT
jgi:hypothetical protein